MSMTLANADSYIAKVIGGSNDTGKKAEARDALRAVLERLDLDHDFNFQLQDTSQSFTVADCDPTVGTTLTTNTANGFKNVLVGMTVSGTDITAGSKVASITSTTEIELDTAATGTTTGTITFGGTIPVISGTNSYTLPSPFKRPYFARLVSTQTRPLIYVRQNHLDLATFDQTVTGAVTHYTLYNAASFDASSTQQGKLKLWRTPAEDDVLLLRYYRPFDVPSSTDADLVDVPDQYLYTVLNAARVELMANQDGIDPNRLMRLYEKSQFAILDMIAKDLEEGGEAQFEEMKSPNEIAHGTGYQVGWPNSDWIYPY